MEPHLSMDKKASLRGAQLPNKGGTEPPIKEHGGKKWTPQHVRKKEWERGADSGARRGSGWKGGRPPVRYVRPREKTGGKVELCGGEPESGSLYCTGGKKRQNITHLLDWWGPSHRGNGSRGGGGGGGGSGRVRRYSSHTPKYSKEHYLQANCQFVVEDGGDYSLYTGNQDLLVEWGLVEEVRLHVTNAPSCPICLHPPTAAKVTRCGHIYCFPCVLHYLALSDKRWRKCPICYEPIEKEDLKSVVAVCHGDFALGEEVEFQLMRRERDSLLPVPASAFTPDLIAKPPRITQPSAALPYAKLIVASKDEVQSQVVAREKEELVFQLEVEGDQPESCFIHQALELLRCRQNSLSSNSSVEDITAIESGVESLALSSTDELLSSSESFSSLDDLVSPVSPTTTADAFSLPRDPEDETVQGEGDGKPGDNSEVTMGAGGNDEVAVGADRECKLLTEAAREVTGTGHGEDHTVSVEDLDISQLQPNAGTTGGQTQCVGPKPTFYFYQASNGAHVYLHSLNIKMLVQEYGSLEHCPPIIKARLVEKMTVSMTEELRGRLRYLRHLPLSCSFELAEVAVRPPLVSKLTVEMFQDQVDVRQRARNRRAREERKIEKRVQAEEDRMLGRSKGATNLKINSFKQFPSFSDEDFPHSGEAGSVDYGGGGVGAEVSGSEVSPSTTTSDALYASSPVESSTGMSFAKMIREGHPRVSGAPWSAPASSSSSGGSVWPSLGGPTAPHTKQPGGGGGGSGNQWDGKQRNLGTNRPDPHSEDEEEEEFVVPEYKHAFSAAVARALDAAASKKSTATAEGVEGRSDGKKGKNKKKKKQVILFSSGGLN
ncbi:hypothetical protein Pcinc_012648 [Petrolisthes cinctipes]|uniref:E3 ubiquitin-protein ligase RNF10 n=1 Tax=Petrolisthes cinctipes TaxID=88211 RepID=A0AAE1KR78_PETCI|nr:hypothetical protein Pcinc_012648 [Petrolisthes cinctipes]